MAKVTLGGKEYVVPPAKFATLKVIWPLVNKAQNTEQDPMEAISTAVAIISAGLVKANPEMTPEYIEEILEPSEMANLKSVIEEMMVEAGLIVSGASSSGEVAAPGNPSTETSTA